MKKSFAIIKKVLASFAIVVFLIIFGRTFFLKPALGLIFKIVNPSNIEALSLEKNTPVFNYKLIDVRNKAEFDIAHLPNAINIPLSEINEKTMSLFNISDTLVFYCSVGYRSGIAAKIFKENTFQNVFNLEGGIFKAKNEKFSLVNIDDTPTDSLHVFNFYWSFLVANGVKVY